jgi:hypothetical protein
MKRHFYLVSFMLFVAIFYGCGPEQEQSPALNPSAAGPAKSIDTTAAFEESKVEYSIDGSSNSVALPKQPSDFDIASIFSIKFFFSFEESSDDGAIFRPSGYKFPPSYPRPGFKFDADGQYTSYQPAANDAGTVPEMGLSWKQLGESNWFQILRNGEPEEVFILNGGPEKIKRQKLKMCVFPSKDPKCF